MTSTAKELLTTQLPMKTLAFAAGILFASQGTAIAQQCIDNMPPGWLTPGSVTAPTPEDRLAITDVMSHFFWARDSKVSTGLSDLFTSDIVYELCTEGGSKQVALRTGPDDVNAYLGDLTTFLNLLVLRTRHIASNTILSVSGTNTVVGKTTVLVLLQNAYSELPELDYTATLKTEFKKGNDGKWRFSRLTLIGDTTVPGATGARGR